MMIGPCPYPCLNKTTLGYCPTTSCSNPKYNSISKYDYGAGFVPEEDVLKFYYVRSLDDYWIGQRVGNLYYAQYRGGHWTWTHSRYLPWGEHVSAPETAWKEHTYPSQPEEIPFEKWMEGFMEKHLSGRARKGKWTLNPDGSATCSECGRTQQSAWDLDNWDNFCHFCGADMREGISLSR